MVLEENFFEEVDRDELDRTIQQIQEAKFFQREFAKDLKKFEGGPAKGASRPKKNDMIDSFIEGEIKLADIIVRMNETKGAKQAAKDNRRISEMFAKKQEKNEAAKPDESAFFTLKDFLQDMDEEEEKKVVQTEINFRRVMT